jgi:hypothetical protein
MGLDVEFEHRLWRQVGKQNCGAVFIDNLEQVWGLRGDSERKEVRLGSEEMCPMAACLSLPSRL